MVGARIAIATKCLAQPLKKALHTVGAMPCDGVQIDLRHELPESEVSDTGLRQLRKLLDDLNLRVGSAAFPTRRGFADPEHGLVVAWATNARIGEPRHNARNRAINTAIYEDLGLT